MLLLKSVVQISKFLKFKHVTNFQQTSATIFTNKHRKVSKIKLPVEVKIGQNSKGVKSRDENVASTIIFNYTPKHFQPFLKLSRLHKPVGSWLLFWPCSWGIACAAAPGTFPDFSMLAIFGAGALIMRGVGCTINDMWDRDVDAKVERTKRRPLVTGEISMQKAVIYLGGQLTIALAILLQLNWYSIFLGTSSLVLVVLYPLMKRFTNWPQLVLGFTFNWGVLLGYSAVKNYVDFKLCLPLYLAGVCWTIIYDTIYAHQDRLDDLRIGIKSTAIIFKENTKLWLCGFNVAMTNFLILSGLMNFQTWPYYAAVGFFVSHLANQIINLDINSRSDCSHKFTSNSWIGSVLFFGIILGNLLKENPKKITSSK